MNIPVMQHVEPEETITQEHESGLLLIFSELGVLGYNEERVGRKPVLAVKMVPRAQFQFIAKPDCVFFTQQPVRPNFVTPDIVPINERFKYVYYKKKYKREKIIEGIKVFIEPLHKDVAKVKRLEGQDSWYVKWRFSLGLLLLRRGCSGLRKGGLACWYLSPHSKDSHPQPLLIDKKSYESFDKEVPQHGLDI